MYKQSKLNNSPKDWFIATKIKEKYGCMFNDHDRCSVLTLPDGSKLEIGPNIRNLPKNMFSSEDNHDPELLDYKFESFVNNIDPYLLADLKKKI